MPKQSDRPCPTCRRYVPISRTDQTCPSCLQVVPRVWTAHLVFRQEHAHSWDGMLLNPRDSRDIWYPEDDRGAVCEVHIYEYADGRCGLETAGRQKGGRRHRLHPDLDTAQRAAMNWAAHRFYVL